MSATRRLFFALWPDEAVRGQLAAACAALAEASGGRPVAPANYHVTLAFLGSVPNEALPAIVAAVEGLAAPAVTLRLDTLGAFPAAGVLWLGAATGPPELAALAAGIRDLMTGLGLRPDEKPFQPHVTIARHVPRRPRLAALPALADPVAWPVRDFALVDSVTDPAGARYTVFARFPEARTG